MCRDTEVQAEPDLGHFSEAVNPTGVRYRPSKTPGGKEAKKDM